MVNLSNLLKKISVLEQQGPAQAWISGVQLDSRRVAKGGLFFAVRGAQADGHLFIDKAIQNGATAIVCEEIPADLAYGVSYIKVANTQDVVGILASEFYDNPSKKLRLVGVTGTNGKTTTATLLYRLFQSLGYRVGLLSTIGNFINEKPYPTNLTTPDAVSMQQMMAEMVADGCDYCFMEASSHAIVQQRIAGLHFVGAIFSNITHDHLDYHKTFDQYIKAKKLFFDLLPSNAFALVNTDDKNGMVMVQNTKAKVHTYSLKSFSDYKCHVLENLFEGMLLDIDKQEVWTKFVGKFNAYNLLSVYAAAVLLGQPKQDVLTAISALEPVNGRFETIRSADGLVVIVDYAHTPDALVNVLNTINDVRTGNGQLISLVGCGGDRDKTKRPEMARVVADAADKVILTSDNPRSEKPEDIIADMKQGIKREHESKTVVIVDRLEAIKTAIMLARPNDIILIPGKGHEDYQEINGVKHHFSDQEIVRDLFAQRHV